MSPLGQVEVERVSSVATVQYCTVTTEQTDKLHQFFYELPRFSTDLDFNLINLDRKKVIFDVVPSILSKYGEVTDKYIKANTIFFFLVHTKGRSGIKIEISTREVEKVNQYELLEFYGTSMLIMKKEDIFANKLIALKNRHSASSRDLFDINFFFKNNWEISENLIETVSKKIY